MAFSKANSFDETPLLQSLWSKAHAHPARVIILTYLLEHGTTSFAVLRRLIPLASTTVSQHLRFLRKIGFVEPEEKCPHTFYKINNSVCAFLSLKISELPNQYIYHKSSPLT